MKKLNQFHDGKIGSALTVSVIFGAEDSKILKIMKDGTVHISLKQKEAGEEADEALVRFLAQQIGCAANSLEIIGSKGRNKLISVIGVTPNEIDEIMYRLAN